MGSAKNSKPGYKSRHQTTTPQTGVLGGNLQGQGKSAPRKASAPAQPGVAKTSTGKMQVRFFGAKNLPAQS